uniref:Uncharacterized protein n=1 Tax=Meloidogyne enterolobii TaxID=390850 RepID=A0A6V7WNP9_MELEN|nr:unnamed protein product [Meloidogyne enterolobii]
MSRQNSFDQRYPLTQYKLIVDFKCSRYYPISDINNQRKSLILILKEINSRTKGIKKERDDDRIIDNIPWMKIMEVFLPLPQWRREELLHVYCNKVLRIYNMDLETCFEKTFADYQSLRSIRKFLLKKAY